MNFDDYYSRDGLYFSQFASDGMIMCLDDYNVPLGSAVDIGAGEGRNSLYLAERGFYVYAIEPSSVGSSKIKNLAEKNHIGNLEIINSDFLTAAESIREIDFVLALTSLEHMDYPYLCKTVDKIKEIMRVGAYIYIVVFTVDDPGYAKDIDNASECAMYVKHYFHHNELKNFFNDFEIIIYKEYLKEDTSHGPKHYHGKAKLFARKIK